VDGDPLGLLVFLIKEETSTGNCWSSGRPRHTGRRTWDLEQLTQFGDVDQVTWLRNLRHFMECLDRGSCGASATIALSLIFWISTPRPSRKVTATLGDRSAVGRMLLAESVTGQV
jgi:hypothetical protein